MKLSESSLTGWLAFLFNEQNHPYENRIQSQGTEDVHRKR